MTNVTTKEKTAAFPMSMIILVGLLLVSEGSSALPTINKTICAFPLWGIRTKMAAHTYYATTHYADKFPNISWSARYLNTNEEPRTSPKNIVRSWVLRGTGCDALVGILASSLAVVVSPLVEVPWLAEGATSTELSDKSAHPTFSRVVPTDEEGAKAAAILYRQFGWNNTNILCADEPYGRSVTNGVTTAIRGMGGVVDLSMCLEADTTGDRVVDALDSLLASPTKVVFMAMTEKAPFYHAFRDEVVRRNASNDLIFFFPEGFCSIAPELREFPGALCVRSLVNQDVIDPFLAGYRARDLGQERSQLSALGFPNTTDINDETNVYAILAHDAAHHMMSALHAHYLSGSTEELIPYMRRHQSQGATGIVTLDAKGDRLVIDAGVFNAGVDGRWNAIGTIKNQTFEYTDSDYVPTTERPPILLLNQTFSSSETLPSVVAQADTNLGTTDEGGRLGFIIGLIFGVVMSVIVMVGLPLALYFRNQGRRDVSTAPTDNSTPFAIVFTDIQSSTAMWARMPVTMSKAVDDHHAIIRQLIKAHNGYEVKTIGDSFMCAFQSCAEAVQFGSDVQVALYRHDWGDQREEGPVEAGEGVGGPSIESVYQELIAESNNPLEQSADAFEGNGLRVRIGLHYGEGKITLDEVTKGYDYYGTVVNTAARVEAVGHGGQFIITDDALSALAPSVKASFRFSDLGLTELKGLESSVRLHQVDYAGSDKDLEGFKRRAFPSLRLAKAAEFVSFSAPDEQATTEQAGDSTFSNPLLGLSITDSKVSLHEYRNASLEQQARRHAKRSEDPHFQDRLLEFQYFVSVLLSTSDRPDREKTVQQFSAKWRVPIGGERTTGRRMGDLKDDLTYQSTLLDVACKVMAVTDRSRWTRNSKVQASGVYSHSSHSPGEGNSWSPGQGNSISPFGRSLPCLPTAPGDVQETPHETVERETDLVVVSSAVIPMEGIE